MPVILGKPQNAGGKEISIKMHLPWIENDDFQMLCLARALHLIIPQLFLFCKRCESKVEIWLLNNYLLITVIIIQINLDIFVRLVWTAVLHHNTSWSDLTELLLMCRSIETAFIILHFALKEPDFLVILWSGLKQQFSRLSKGFFRSLYVIIFRARFLFVF